MWLRCTRNIDKERGFCNGALGRVEAVLCNEKDEKGKCNIVFTMRLTTGVMILVHPLMENNIVFLPCVYGYAMSMRKAQGATLSHVVLYFDLPHDMVTNRGMAYVTFLSC